MVTTTRLSRKARVACQKTTSLLNTPLKLGSPIRIGLLAVAIYGVSWATLAGYREARMKEERIAAADEKQLARMQVDSATHFGRCWINENDLIIGWNKGMTRLFGWTSKEMVGQRADRIFPDDPVDRATAEAIFRTHNFLWVAKGGVRLLTKDGREVECMVLIADLQGNTWRREITLISDDNGYTPIESTVSSRPSVESLIDPKS